jgi:hypothetical protein
LLLRRGRAGRTRGAFSGDGCDFFFGLFGAAAGCAVLCWTVNDRRSAKKLLGWGVDCLVTDRLDRIGPGFA